MINQKIDIIQKLKDRVIFQQIELKNGLLFMRLKSRKIDGLTGCL